MRKNVSFSSDNGYSLNISSPSDEEAQNDERKSILKKDNLITGRTKVGFNVDADSNGEKKPKSNEAYEILVYLTYLYLYFFLNFKFRVLILDYFMNIFIECYIRRIGRFDTF